MNIYWNTLRRLLKRLFWDLRKPLWGCYNGVKEGNLLIAYFEPSEGVAGSLVYTQYVSMYMAIFLSIVSGNSLLICLHVSETLSSRRSVMFRKTYQSVRMFRKECRSLHLSTCFICATTGRFSSHRMIRCYLFHSVLPVLPAFRASCFEDTSCIFLLHRFAKARLLFLQLVAARWAKWLFAPSHPSWIHVILLPLYVSCELSWCLEGVFRLANTSLYFTWTGVRMGAFKVVFLGELLSCYLLRSYFLDRKS